MYLIPKLIKIIELRQLENKAKAIHVLQAFNTDIHELNY